MCMCVQLMDGRTCTAGRRPDHIFMTTTAHTTTAAHTATGTIQVVLLESLEAAAAGAGVAERHTRSDVAVGGTAWYCVALHGVVAAHAPLMAMK